MREEYEKIIEKIENIIDTKNIDECIKEELREIINMSEKLFCDIEFELEEAKDTIEMMEDNLHGDDQYDYFSERDFL